PELRGADTSGFKGSGWPGIGAFCLQRYSAQGRGTQCDSDSGTAAVTAALLSQEGSTIETAVEIVRGVVPKPPCLRMHSETVRLGNHPRVMAPIDWTDCRFSSNAIQILELLQTGGAALLSQEGSTIETAV